MLDKGRAEIEPLNSAQEHFVDVTPRPVFSWLKRSNDGMTGGAKMLRGVAVWR
jgi:hypothetical protein